MRSKALLYIWLFCFSSLSVHTLHAQDYQVGYLTDGTKQRKEIYYDRTQMVVADNVYKSLYKVFDKKNRLQYTVTLVHNKPQSLLLITVRPENAPSFGNTIKYDRNMSGLVFSNVAKLDTNHHIENYYTYLFSFADIIYEYAALHKIKADASLEIILDPLSNIRLKKHNALVTKLLQSDPSLSRLMPETEAKTSLFNRQLVQLRDTLEYKGLMYNRAVDTIQRRIQEDVLFYFKKEKMLPEEVLYKGDKVKGKANGRGVMILKNSVYDGNFKSGNFTSGYVTLKREEYDYTGNYSNDTFNGLGLLKYHNGNYFLGIFQKGQLDNGISRVKLDSVSSFYGAILKGNHTGYGELLKAEEELYAGEFLDDKLIKGYSRQYDKRDELVCYKTEYGERLKLNTTDGEKFIQLLLSQFSKK